MSAFRLSDLPDDVLAIVLRHACLDAQESSSRLGDTVVLLAVCRRWRHLALPAVYSTLFVRYSESVPEYPSGSEVSMYESDDATTETYLGHITASTNLDLIASADCVRMVKRADIRLSCFHNLEINTENLLGHIESVSGKWSGVKLLSIDISPVTSRYEGNTSDSNDHVQQLANTLAALMPGVRSLRLASGDQRTDICALLGRVAAAYAGQLHTLRVADGIYMPEGTIFEQLGSLDIYYSDGLSGLLSCVRPDTLERLKMRSLPQAHYWPSAGTSHQDPMIDFPRLRALELVYVRTRSSADPDDMCQRVVRFPKLEHLRLECVSGPCPFLKRAVFPPNMAYVGVSGAGKTLRLAAKIPVAVTGTLAVSVSRAETDPDVFADVERVLDKVQGRGAAVLNTNSNMLPLVPEHIHHTALARLRVEGLADLDAVVALIGRLPNLVSLALHRVTLEASLTDFSIPGAGEPALAPFGTRLRDLTMRFERGKDPRMELAVEAVKYLLLRVPTLVTFSSSVTPDHLPEDFIDEYLPQYPNLARVSLVPYVL